MDSKLNKVFQKLPEGVVATQVWLERQGVYRQLTRRYLTSGWLERFGHGAFVQAGDTVDWLGAVHTLQTQLGLDVHVAAETALQLMGRAHFVPLGDGFTVCLFGEEKTRLPTWFVNRGWPVQIDFRRPRLFEDGAEIGFSQVERNRYSVRVAAPERAIFEVVYLSTTNAALEHAHTLMTGQSTLRPDVVQQLLEQCRSVRVKRYFLWSAQTADHAWFKKIDRSHVHLGSGNRQLFKGGVYDAEYKITVPLLKEEMPGV